ncbi:MAG: recombination protein NinG [Paludibacteraceae bacterium]|nr:recombination protein NinG [Paludibacteraceae bacterium]
MNKDKIKQLDCIFSEYIRLRDANRGGYVSCISCGARISWKNSDAGHYVPRGNMSLRFDEKNVNAIKHYSDSELDLLILHYRKEVKRLKYEKL